MTSTSTQTPATDASGPEAGSAPPPVTVSFVVPTRNSARTLENCLRSIRDQSYPHLELIVVDNTSTDPTVLIALEYADTVFDYGPERSAQRNAGARAARGAVIAFIDSDMVLDPAVAAESVDCFAGDAAVGALVLPERSFGVGFLARCRALEKRLYLGDPSVEAARVFRREAVDFIGGYNETLYAAEDWEFADRVRTAGWGVGRLEAGVLHDEGRISLSAQFRKKRYYGRNLRRYLGNPQIASRPVRRGALLARPGELLRSPLLTTGLVVLKSVEAAGLLCGAAAAKQVRDR